MEALNRIDHTSVVIIGGGITGLAAALFLEREGIDFVLIEKHKGTSILPRARTIDIRAMEIFREIGLSEELKEGGKSLAPAWGILRGDNLVKALEDTDSEIIGKIIFPSELKEMRHLAQKSPETGCRCTQDISESILYENLKKKGTDLRFYNQMLSFERNPDFVEVKVEDRETNKKYQIRARYMIAADGANSSVREELNIPVSGSGSWIDLLNIYFESDLESLVKGREFSQLLIQTPEITGFLLAINNKDKWAFHLRYFPEKGEKPSDFTPERLLPILRKVLAIPEINIRILNILPWQLTVRVADFLQVNNIFIAGDAAHTMTPYAGKGANSGIQDVHNLIWKLALVLKEKASKDLLETYSTERQPVGAFYAKLSGELADEHGLVNDKLLLKKGAVLLGLPDYKYNSKAIISNKNDSDTPFSGIPGTCIPHMWIDSYHKTSTLDWTKGQFSLVINTNSEYWNTACEIVKDKLDIAIQICEFHTESMSANWCSLTSSSFSDALLIRPDGFVAAKISNQNPEDYLYKSLIRILCYD